jgi:hypothetical protein
MISHLKVKGLKISSLRRFWSLATPPLRRILLIESGSREHSDNWLRWLQTANPHACVDLLTCFDGSPAHLAPGGAVFQTQDYITKQARTELIEEFRRNRYDVIAVLCTGEPVMTKWKWYVAAAVPAKVLIVNENTDFFWLHRNQWATIGKFASARLGLSGAGAARMPLQLLALPFSLAYVTAATLYFHLRRRLT